MTISAAIFRHRAALAALLVVGCGDDGGRGLRPDAGVLADLGADAEPDASSGAEGSPPDARRPAADAARSGDTAPDGPARPDALVPTGPVVKKRLAIGRLAGDGGAACSHQVPASGNGHRWCAFYRDEPARGRTSLWVIDVAEARARTVACDGSDPACLRLTDALWTGTPEAGGPAHPYAHRFDGDTLVYHAGAPARPRDFYEGPIFAWRPGWPRGRAITTGRGYACHGHRVTDVAYCVERLELEGNVYRFDLRAGRLSAEAVDGPLPLVDRITALGPDGVPRWAASYTASGDRFLYSTARDPRGRETLYASATSELGRDDRRITLGEDVARWQIAPDDRRIFFLRRFNYDPTDPSGMLAIMPVGGGAATELPARVGGFIVLSDGSAVDRGVAILQDPTQGRGTLRIMRDPAAPDSAVEIAPGVVDAHFSPDLRYVVYSRMQSPPSYTMDLHVARVDGTAACTLQSRSTTMLLGTPFLGDGSVVFWADQVDDDLHGEGWLANADGCTGKTKFADRVDRWTPVGSEGIVYTDQASRGVADVRVARLDRDRRWPSGGGTVVVSGATAGFSLAGANVVLFTATSPDGEGEVHAAYDLPFAP